MTDRPNLKQIRIKRSVCDRLDDRKGKDDSYTDVVKELLDENERLKDRVEELERDKNDLTVIAMALKGNQLVKRGITDGDEVQKALEDIKNFSWRNE